MQTVSSSFRVVGVKPAGLAVHSHNHPGTTVAAFGWK